MRAYLTSAQSLLDHTTDITARMTAWRDAAIQFDQHGPYRHLKALVIDVEGLARSRCTGEALIRFLCQQLGVRRLDTMSEAAQRFARTSLKDARLSKESVDERGTKRSRLGDGSVGSSSSSSSSANCHAGLRSCKARTKADCTHWCSKPGCPREACKRHRRDDSDRNERNDRGDRDGRSVRFADSAPRR